MKLPIWLGYVAGGLQVAAGVALIILGKSETGIALVVTGLTQFGVHKLTP
jgi:hypothetical protein